MPEGGILSEKELTTGFREVTPDQLFPEKWKEFTVNIGGTQALQEIKVPERAGGYAYKDPVKLFTRNRFIYWRISHDTLELVEHSLDVNLIGNAVRYRFQDTPVLEGVSLHETDRAVIVLLATVSSVHKLSFPHPDHLCTEDSADFALTHHPDIGLKSIFADATLSAVRDPASFHVLNSISSGAALPYISASLLTVEGDSLFALGYPSGLVLLVRMSVSAEEVSVRELKEETFVPRFLSGITNALIGRGGSSEAAVSLVLHSIGLETYLFCLHRDGVLAMWSCGRISCVCSIDILQGAGSEPGQHATEGVQSHVLRKAHDSQNNHLLLAVYLCFASGSQVCLVKPTYQQGITFNLNLMCTIQAPASDLVELVLSSRSLWAVWRGPAGQPMVSRALLEPSLSRWQLALLEPPPDIEAGLRDDMDISEQYLSYIFRGSYFTVPVITRALALFRRSSLLPETTLSYSKLRERVSRAVEAEIQKVAQGVEMTDEDYMDIAYQSWSRFYSDCVQYSEKSTRPLGLLQLGETGLVLVKRQQYSLLRPMELTEQLLLAPETATSAVGGPLGSGGGGLAEMEGCAEGLTPELVRLMGVLSLLEQHSTPELKGSFCAALEESQNPEQCVAELLRGPPTTDTETLLTPAFLQDLGRRLQGVGDLYAAATQLIQLLTLEVMPVDADLVRQSLIPGKIPSVPSFLVCLFASSIGNSLVAQSLQQIALARLSTCRNLLVLLHLLAERRQAVGSRLDPSQLDTLRSTLTPHIVVLTQAYHSVVWLGSTPAAQTSRATLESVAEQLGLLGLDRLAPPPAYRPLPVGKHGPLDHRPPSLLELVMQGCNCMPARNLLALRDISEDVLAPWTCSLHLYTMCLCKVVWPVSTHLTVPQLLLALSQRRLTTEYVQLLAGWCEWNSALRQFTLGAALLYGGEPHKALDVLLGAVHSDAVELLLEQLHGRPPAYPPDDLSPLVQYYMLLIKMFSHLKHWDCVLALAEAGVTQAAGPEEMSTLNLVSFNAHLHLGHHTNAFNSLVAIPDRERSRLCLRQLVTTMFERLRLDALLEFPHQSLFDDLETIVLSRARAMDVQHSTFYNFLYAFHMKQGNVRKAANAMLEMGLRVASELPASLVPMQRRAHCYLACLNALRLAAPGFQWLVRPAPTASPNRRRTTPLKQSSPEHGEGDGGLRQRRVDGADVFALSVKTRVQLLQLEDIERDYELINSQLLLLKLNPAYYSNIVGDLTAQETVTACINGGLYEAALTVGCRFGLPLEPVFCHLTRACVNMTKKGLSNSEDTWAWLKENDVWEFGIGDANALDLSWKLLEVALSRHEPEEGGAGSSSLHQAVTHTLVRCGSFLPHWLLASYRRRNPSELLRLLLAAGRLVEAAALGLRMLWAALGRGSRTEVGLANGLAAGSPPLCLPMHTLDRLILELKHAAKSQPAVYSEPLEELQKVHGKYLSEAVRASQQQNYRAQVCSYLPPQPLLAA